MAQGQFLPRDTDFEDVELEMPDDEPATKEQRELFDKIKRGASAASDQWKMSLFRAPVNSMGRPIKAGLVFLSEHDIDEFETFNQILLMLMERYGGGSYRIQVRDDNGRLQMNQLVMLEEPRVKNSAAQQNQSPDMAAMFGQFQASMEKQNRFIAELMQRQFGENRQKNDGSEMDKMMQYMTLFGGMMQMMMGMVKPEGAAASGADPLGSILKQAEQWKMLREVISGDGGSSGESNGWGALVALADKGLPLLSKALEAQVQRPAQRPQLSSPQSSQPAAPLTNQPEGTPAVDEQTKQYRAKLQQLVTLAQANFAPETAANLVLSQIPENSAEESALIEMLEKPQCVDLFISINENVAPFKEWFERLRAALLAQFDEGGQTDSQPGIVKSPDQPPDKGTADAIERTGESDKPAI